MRWTVWDDRHAAGVGIAHVNDCRPDCADGHYARYRVTVRLAHPRKFCGSRFFTTLPRAGAGVPHVRPQVGRRLPVRALRRRDIPGAGG